MQELCAIGQHIAELKAQPLNIWDCSAYRDLKCVLSRFIRMKCPLHIASYALRIGVSVMELQGAEFLNSIHFNANTSVTFLLRFYYAYWKFYHVCARSHFWETIPFAQSSMWNFCKFNTQALFVDNMYDC